MNVPLFSVLIANYNNGAYIGEALNSLLKQDYIKWEAIIVDDASTDNSVEIINTYLKDTRIKLFFNDNNSGCGYTKRKCVSLASGDICGFLDPDDALIQNALSTMVKAHQQNAGCSMIYSTHYRCNEQLQHPEKVDYGGAVTPGYSYLADPLKKIISHFASFKKDFYNQTDGISATLKKAVDQDLYYKLEESGPVKYIDIPLYLYRIHKQGISTGLNVIPALIAHYKVKIAAFNRRHNNNKIAAMYPEDNTVFKYEYLKSNLFFYKLRGNKLKALQFFSQIVLRFPVRCFREFVLKQPLYF